MKSISKQNIVFFIGLLFSLPTAYFIFINILNDLGYSQLFDSAWPTFQSWGIQESFGWNINLLILFGPVLALTLNLMSVLHLRFDFSKQSYRLSVNRY